MRAVLTRVKSASVTIDGEVVGKIGQGFLILLGVGPEDTEKECKYLAEKALGLRIFTDENDKMNLSVKDVGGSILAVSNFTLCADCKKGHRPSFSHAMEPVMANKLYEEFCGHISSAGIDVGKGVFGADMQVELVNDGPVTILLDSTKLF